MSTRARHFATPLLDKLTQARLIGVRSGAAHRFTTVWVVVARGRVFARSWNDKPRGWRAAFLSDPNGSLRISGRSFEVRARPVRGPLLLAAINRAYEQKYTSRSDLKWVPGLLLPSRVATTTEFVPG